MYTYVGPKPHRVLLNSTGFTRSEVEAAVSTLLGAVQTIISSGTEYEFEFSESDLHSFALDSPRIPLGNPSSVKVGNIIFDGSFRDAVLQMERLLLVWVEDLHNLVLVADEDTPYTETVVQVENATRVEAEELARFLLLKQCGDAPIWYSEDD